MEVFAAKPDRAVSAFLWARFLALGCWSCLPLAVAVAAAGVAWLADLADATGVRAGRS